MRASRILVRRRDFERFLAHAAPSFEEIAGRDARHPERAAVYGFALAPGGRDGGGDRRVVEVFYGTRHLEGRTEYVSRDGLPPRRHHRSVGEWGATLEYQRMDNGTVLCTLSPAGSENFRRHERTVFVEWIRATDRLRSKAMLERHWRLLASYMEVTSLEGEPTLTDRLRVGWVLFTRSRIVGKEYDAAPVRVWIWRLLTFAATVGLSGFLLALVQWIFSAPNPPP
ncbi:hypothetical protein MBLL_04259 [Methylobacterium bullatum]|uniref:Uncharacterized protein n=2 Tax=Methylobacterium bullatum TaxID=570505 RepID=A0A679KD01_9HYPH|nr:hypothetical protein MBLL_04259 [Methylobacterium bullatum]